MGINSEQLLILIVIAVIVIGPERLPRYAEQFANLVKQLKKMATGATEKVKEELGEEAKDLDLSQLDPRKYDPRRIVREALAEDDILPASKPARSAAARNAAARNRRTGSSSSRSTSKPKPPPTRTNRSKNSTTSRSGAAKAATAAGTTAVVDAAGETEVSVDGNEALATVPFDDEAT